MYVEFAHLPKDIHPTTVNECLECGDESTGPPFYHQVWKLQADYKCIRCRAGAFRKDGTPSTKTDIEIMRLAINAWSL